ncbi:serine/threonine kinase family protein [Plesiocystis pacifica SIR-1]|uniref:Serine/threonine kinase family protein n=1 Tax=Plesiocystis pacifica SIR-1 TaxID=391625 RepID=A6GDU0_9BACT|nr:tetratricopeptide repeat protein [Plesiocystis pacifica]EDM75979.1 serine/threonine kinase family protein [Plesiocystis pacifica SIR-1]
MESSQDTLPATGELAAASTVVRLSGSGERNHQGERAAASGLRRRLDKGDALGRYVVLRKLGAGGMGTVYLGYDPELDRRVALKILRGGTDEANRRALLREAQAMAKLTHPNVVAVHDVGEHNGRVYVAMAFVEGRTLRAWLEHRERRWRDILALFLLAGEGLRAAHASELIHRDFKPDNVMVSRRREVLVMDFGLARPSANTEPTNDADVDSISGSSSVLTEATVGHIAGTPAYMAPEQLRADALTPAADQFAFCVSLWEALYGERPFDGQNLGERYTNITEQRVRPLPKDARSRAPRWLEQVLRRGLAPEPEQRWPSLGALLDALDRGRRRWRWQGALAGVGVLAVGASLALGWRQHEREQARARVAACEAEGAVIDAIWNPAARERIETNLLATELDFTRDDLETLLPWLDDYAGAWRSGRAEVCAHGSIAGDWDAERLDRAAWCFEDRRFQLEATVDQLATLDRKTARRAVRIASYLDPIDSCLDPTALRRLPLPPPDIRPQLQRVRAQVVAADRLRNRGEFEEALELARQARIEAEALDWPPLLATARFAEGRAELINGLPTARASLERAYFGAMDAGAVEVAFRSARSLATTLANQGSPREAQSWMRHAEVLAAELPDPTGLDAAEGHYLMLKIHLGLGDYAAAIDSSRAAVELRTQAIGARHPITASAIRNLGMAKLADGQARAALQSFDESLALWRPIVGERHPYVAQLLTLRGEATLAMGEVDRARELLERALELHAQIPSPEQPYQADTLTALARAQLASGRLEDAARSLTRAMAIRRKAFGPRHPTTAALLVDQAALALARGDLDQAQAHCARGLAIAELVLEPGHPEFARVQERCVQVDLARGEPEQAERRRQDALSRLEVAHGTRDPRLITPLVQLADSQRARADFEAARASYARALDLAAQLAPHNGSSPRGDQDRDLELGPPALPCLVGLAELALLEGDGAEALRRAETAEAILDRARPGPRPSAEVRFVHAKALVRSGGDLDRARRLAERARDAHAAAHDDAAVAEVERWLSLMP